MRSWTKVLTALNCGAPAVPSHSNAAVSTVAWSHQGTPTYSFEGIISYSAATVAWLKRQPS